MLALLVSAAWGQAAPAITWSPVLEVRERVLGEEGPAGTDGLVEHRARLGAEVERLNVSARVTFEDVRTWAIVEGRVPYASDGPALAEGWVRVRGDLTRKVGLVATVGRQAIRLHEGRILGDDPFTASGRQLDAVRVLGRAAPFSVEYVNARNFDEGPVGRAVNVVRAGAGGENPVTTWTADALWVHDGRALPDGLSTLGGYARLDTGRLRTRADGYLQLAEAGTASLVGVSAGWVFGPNERLVAHVRYEGLSGVADGMAWTPVLGDSRTFQGLLDVYASPAARPDGLSNLQLVVDVRPVPPVSFGVTAHGFTDRRTGAPLAGELDGHLAWSFSPFAVLRTSGAWFVPAATTGDDPRLLGYLELDASF